MKTILWIILAIIVIGGGWYWWSSMKAVPTAAAPSFTASSTGSFDDNAAPAVQGSASPASGTAMLVPGSNAAPIVGDNLMLGIDENSVLGTYLIGYTGMTLYTYEKDTGASSTCYAECAAAWPPYIVSPSDHLNLQYGVNASDVSTITREDGTLQVTYGGHPLYFFSGDKNGSDTMGEGLGGVWYVAKS